jgi:hypothetical protein
LDLDSFFEFEGFFEGSFGIVLVMGDVDEASLDHQEEPVLVLLKTFYRDPETNIQSMNFSQLNR